LDKGEVMTWQKELNEKRVKDKAWYGCIAPDGWKDIVLKADEMFAHIDPNYQIFQIKEKFGTLRYYFGSTHEYDSIEYSIMRAIEVWAERRSESTCESCGKYGELRTERYWIVTLCDTCNEERAHEQPNNSDN
jgi:hypothetical protein